MRIPLYGIIGRKDTFPARELHRNYSKLVDAVNTINEISVRTECSVETIKREKRRLFQGR
jgi:hypothetical protein